jgi:hypothetical protein
MTGGVITPILISNGIRLALVIQQTNSAGVVRTLASPVSELTGVARTVEVMVGDVDLRVTPIVNQRPPDDKEVGCRIPAVIEAIFDMGKTPH